MIRVVVVDDSPIVRALVREWLTVDRDFEVVGEAADGESAIELITRLRPDAATIDVRMPGMSGLELVSYLMAKAPLPILVLTGEVTRDDASLAFEAVRRGALDLLPKPSARDEDAIRALRAQLRRLASVPVVRHIEARRHTAPAASARAPAPASTVVEPMMIGIAASAGGPSALVAVLAALPADLPAAVAIVQHLPRGFVTSFVSFLQARCALPVKLAEPGQPPRPATVVVAPDDHHLEVIDGRFALTNGPPVEGHRPAGTVLLRSLAALGPGAIGVVLSGIGRDGAEGLRAMRDRGALTYAQDAASSVVYGMPRAAVEDGGAQEVLPAGELGEAITAAVLGGRRRRWP
jgi:two-component system, chemotaxis family, protein-glutamate methylesterase/glutaminase